MSLAKMEEEIKPKILKLLESLTKNYLKLQKYQKENLDCILSGKELSVSKNKNYINQSWTYDFLFIGCYKESEKIANGLVEYFNRMYPTKVLINLGSYRMYPDVAKVFKQTLNKMKGQLELVLYQFPK